MAKENSIKMKRETTIWENIFDDDTSDKGCLLYTSDAADDANVV